MNTEKAELFTPAPEWSGRSDGPGPEHARWHSVINQAESAPVTLLGFASDEGVLRNGGRQGAAAGPAALRAALGSLAVHHKHALADAGTITTQSDDLDGALGDAGEILVDEADPGRSRSHGAEVDALPARDQGERVGDVGAGLTPGGVAGRVHDEDRDLGGQTRDRAVDAGDVRGESIGPQALEGVCG